MSSEEIKEMLDDWLTDLMEELEEEEDTLFLEDWEKALGKWKRVSKKKDSSGQWQRIFKNTYLENTALNKHIIVIEDDILGFLAGGEYVFHIDEKESPDEYQTVTISDYAYFKSSGYCSDWHIHGKVAVPSILSEEMEGIFSSKENVATIKQSLLDYGFVEDVDFANFVSDY